MAAPSRCNLRATIRQPRMLQEFRVNTSTTQPASPKPVKSSPVVQVAELRRMREAGEKIACLTCYDASFALIEERAGVVAG